MAGSFKSRFLQLAGARPYAWAASLGLPKTLVTAVIRGGEDYRPIRRTLESLAAASGRSAEWWLTGVEQPSSSVGGEDQPESPGPTPVTAIAAGGRADAELLALAVRVLEEWAKERRLEIAPERKGAIIAVLYDYIRKGAGDDEVRGLLNIVG